MPRRATPQGEGKRIPLMARTTPSLRARLEAAAAASGRSLGQEVEYQLERALMAFDAIEALRETVRQEMRAEFDRRLSADGISQSLKIAVNDMRRDDIARLRQMTADVAQRAVLAATPVVTEKAN